MSGISSDGLEPRRKKALFRAWHRGTKEADLMIGGFFDAHHADWDDAAIEKFEALLEEQDVDIMAWAFGRGEPPAHLKGPMFDRLRALDYIRLAPR